MLTSGWFFVYVLFNIGLLTVLGLNVSLQRIRLGVANGDGGQLTLKKAIRAHGNGVEHITAFGFVALALAMAGTEPVTQAWLIGGFSVGRVLHAAGMLGSGFQLRRVGAGLTFLGEVSALAVLALELASS